MNNNSITDTVVSTVRGTILNNDMIKKGDKILVALSGGADSVTLLDALLKLKDELSISVGAAHLNHMIRGSEADRDESYCAELCTTLSVPFYAERVNVPEIAERDGISEELAGRNARYDFLKRICKLKGYNLIATAHNKNDKAETVLMRIIRGTGIDGLCGIKYTREDGVIRPILDVDREYIEKYCDENGLKYCTDSTNSENGYTRNKIRNTLIPVLKEEFNPNIIETLCNLADNSEEDADFINGYAERLYKRINSPMPKRKPVVLDIESLNMVQESIKSRLIRIASKEVMGEEYKLSKVHMESIKSLLDKETGASFPAPKGLVVSVKYGWLEFTTEKDDALTEAFCYEIDFNDKQTAFTHNVKLQVVEGRVKAEENQMLVDYDKLNDKMLSIRNRKIGDRFVLYKDGKAKKLKDIFIDMKIPRSERGSIPLLCTDKEVIAIIGHRVAENYKVSENTKKVLVITYEG